MLKWSVLHIPTLSSTGRPTSRNVFRRSMKAIRRIAGTRPKRKSPSSPSPSRVGREATSSTHRLPPFEPKYPSPACLWCMRLKPQMIIYPWSVVGGFITYTAGFPTRCCLLSMGVLCPFVLLIFNGPDRTAKSQLGV